MQIKFLVDEDFVNYKKPSMFIGFPYCTFKCDKEYGQPICQNSALANQPNMEIDVDKIVERYVSNPITEAIVMGGLEPFNSWKDLIALVSKLRKHTQDDIVIYTGYNRDELLHLLCYLETYPNIIIKFGRFIPNSCARFDEILGVELQSDNQYAQVIS